MTNSERRKKERKFKIRKRKMSALSLAVFYFVTSIWPTQSFALTGGPSQPEVQSFEPIGTSDMVDLFSGDFTYNIPLLDVDGYPINLAYHSGVTMDQEASWTGLGWNVNVGTVNRAMRGIPDDFKGETIKKEFKRRPNRTYGVEFSVDDIELFGFKKQKKGTTSPDDVINGSIDLGANLGLTYNNYNGAGFSFGLDLSVGYGGASAGLGLNSSSDGGLTIQPNLSYSFQAKEAKQNDSKLGGSVGLGSSFNSRSGLQSLTISGSMSGTAPHDERQKPNKKIGTLGGGGASTSFSFMQPTFSPIIEDPMRGYTVKGRFKTGGAIFGVSAGLGGGFSYSEQTLATNTQSKKAYGYMYTEGRGGNKDVMLDVNREKDGSFSQQTPSLPITNYTYDIYSVSGQGNGGSYRPFRSQISYLFDPPGKTTSTSVTAGVELGVGYLVHSGVDLGVVLNNSKSGLWDDENDALKELKYSNGGYADFEDFYMKEANEKTVTTDESFYNDVYKDKAVYFGLKEVSKFNTRLSNRLHRSSSTAKVYTDNTRDKRERRNNVFSMLSHKEMENGMGLNELSIDADNNARGHHIGEVATLGAEGSRYIYGIAAYNTFQRDVTFAIGADSDTDAGYLASFDDNQPLACTEGLVDYAPGVDNSLANEKGKDYYFEASETPDFAHSYLLTGIISPDYVDIDNVKGPSLGDLGTWTKFSYEKPDYYPDGPGDVNPRNHYRWRVPYKKDVANFSGGLNSMPSDDKANYTYGKKELRYLDKIETKNFVAIFDTSPREDGLGVLGEDGGRDDKNTMMKLDKISLYARPHYEANQNTPADLIPIKEVHFEYDYSLCPGIPNNIKADTDINAGKLTLTKVFFTYRKSQEGALSPYEFHYADFDHDGTEDVNFRYNLKGYNRWGNYKPNEALSCNIDDPLSNAEFSYVEQNKANEDRYASAWSMTSVELPSGGKIKVNYESDDYSYVQGKQAMQMMKIVGVESEDNSGNLFMDAGSGSDDFKHIPIAEKGVSGDKNRCVYIEVPDDPNSPQYSVEDFIGGIDDLYFRANLKFQNIVRPTFDYVSGYCGIKTATLETKSIGGVDKRLLKLELAPVSAKDGGTVRFNPIAITGGQFARLYLSSFAYDASNINPDNALLNVIQAMVNSLANLVDGFKSPNKLMISKGQGNELVINKSWVRLNNPSGNKLGGGCRVKSLSMSDEWSGMTSSNINENFEYGQEYQYTNKDGSSSGVAAYEPQLGGDENPFKTPVKYQSLKRWAPDDRFFAETPFGESFFPTASVGYGRVIVKNLQRDDVKKHASGEVQHEFYTAKEFPTLVQRTDIDMDRDKSSPFGVLSLLGISTKDYLTASQGFSVITNDMHGKPKAQRVYQEGDEDPITSVIYEYQSDAHLTSQRKVNNAVKTISDDGSVNEDSQIGVYFDMVADFRQEKTTMRSPTLKMNFDSFFLGPFGPLVTLIPIPGYTQDKKQFRSSSVTKVVNKFGVLKNTIATDLGSRVETRNLAYDAETGEVLLTETTTNFEDKIYSMNYPAYWHYDQMGPAYKNIGFEKRDVDFSSDTWTDPHKYLVEGDELELINASDGSYSRAWVTDVSTGVFSAVDKQGVPITTVNHIRVLRSGRRNQQMQSMASLTTRANPLESFQNNVYENVVQASAIEFDDKWKTACDCFDTENGGMATTNPYVLGTRGNWRPKTSYLHLTDRTQENYNDNTNIRNDGFFTSYRPFYKWSGSKWEIDRKDWTYTAEVTEFNPYGQELENQDALGRKSAATFGFNQTLATAVAANSGYNEIGFDSFEDYPFSPCADNHFKVDKEFQVSNSIVSTTAHTGFHSLKVSAGMPVTIGKGLIPCEEVDPCSSIVGSYDKIETGGHTFSIAGGIGAITIDYTLVSGNANVTFNPFENTYQVIPVAFAECYKNYRIQFLVTDESGCKKEVEIVYMTNVDGKACIESITYNILQ